MIRVCHLSSAHPADDVRIFLKECRSLAQAGFEVHLVANADGEQTRDGVRIHPVRRAGGRLARMLGGARNAYAQARALDATIYHLHDPELLPYGLLLKRAGKRVIYDAHEDLPRDILSKEWIPEALRGAVAWGSERVENLLARACDAVVAATPHIRDRFSAIHPVSIDVRNYALGEEFRAAGAERGRAFAEREAVAYVGGIAIDRGICEIVRAAARAGCRLKLAGRFGFPQERETVTALPEWRFVEDFGFVGRREIGEILGSAFAGLVVLHPEPNFVNSLPIKMFEYMAAGLPVIVSDFPLWRAIVERHRCGLCVDPRDVAAIAAAITWLKNNPAAAEAMGARGRATVAAEFNWEREGEKLVALYGKLLNGRP
ncbi:glycosyltransferase family 4 protein [Chelatococcus sp. SYSU_G07232]|uniref:Glycosyltransferase family 4 protein n=1 Tax=Chelatococcus albus TaxID=3047466 RepID=A0ABT7AJJ7_9HYPH|nr:glycosyltransferase family 4 protein [Chelatococcus sp. SYSU_G07232]MDJ1158994.1 glycosyltransferase family 4 protein [Chelatococcus sp. SYSU_G07232]